LKQRFLAEFEEAASEYFIEEKLVKNLLTQFENFMNNRFKAYNNKAHFAQKVRVTRFID